MHDSANNNALTPAAAALWQRTPTWAASEAVQQRVVFPLRPRDRNHGFQR
jgi:hypothetical protein